MVIIAAEFNELLQSFLAELWDALQAYGPSIVGALVTLLAGWIGAKIVRAITRRVLRRAKVDDMLIGFITNIVYAMLLVFVFISALGTLGVKTNSFVAIIGAAGLAIGFALQGSLSNFAAGVMIIMLRPFRVGDFVEAAGTSGDIVEIQIFSTILDTKDNKRVIVPNAKMLGGVIVNYSANSTRRVDLVMGIGYDDDLKKAQALFLDILEKHPLVLDNPKPSVNLIALADSSVNFNVRPWCKNGDYWKVYSEVTEAMKLACDENGINIPYPQRDVHMHQVA